MSSELDDILEDLTRIAVHTEQGSVVSMEEVKRLIEKRREGQLVQKVQAVVAPKTIEQARAQAKEYLREMNPIIGEPREPTRSLPAGPVGANDPGQPLSRA